MQRETLRIHTIAECNKHFSQVTLHPLASVIELSEVHSIPHDILFDFYAVILFRKTIRMRSMAGELVIIQMHPSYLSLPTQHLILIRK